MFTLFVIYTKVLPPSLPPLAAMLNLSSVTPRVSHSAGATNQGGGREETNSKPPRVGVEIYELTLSGATHRTEFFLPIRSKS